MIDAIYELKIYAVAVSLLAALAAVVVMQMLQRAWTPELVIPRLFLAALAIALFSGGLILHALPCEPVTVVVVGTASTVILILIGPRAIQGIALT